MSVVLRAVVIEAQDPARVRRYWSELLERPADQVEPGHGLLLDFVRGSDGKDGKNRVHLDLASVSEAHQKTLVQRACDLGGRPIDIGQSGVPWVVLADPEGNEFCILEPRDEYRDAGRIAAVVTDVADPVEVSRYWSTVMGHPVVRTHPEYATLRPGTGAAVEFVRNRDTPPTQGRVHLRLEGDPGGVLSGAGQDCPICGRGCVPATDPEGNRFCVSRPPTATGADG